MTENRHHEDYLYLYGLIPTKETLKTPLKQNPDITGDGFAYTKIFGEITAVVADVSQRDFSEDELERKMQNPEWLQAKAMHHHEFVNELNELYTVIPLKFCTVFQSEESLESEVTKQGDRILALFSFLDRKEEWNVKVFCDQDKFREHMLANDSSLQASLEDTRNLPPGKQFFAKKKMEQTIQDALENAQQHRCEELHFRLRRLCATSTTKSNWGEKLTGAGRQMTWNGVYLVPRDNLDEFWDQLKALREEYEPYGLSLQPTGPWPPYHFSSFQ